MLPVKKYLYMIFNKEALNQVTSRFALATKQLTEWDSVIQEVLAVKEENPDKAGHLLPIEQSKLDTFKKLAPPNFSAIGDYYNGRFLFGDNPGDTTDLKKIPGLYNQVFQKGCFGTDPYDFQNPIIENYLLAAKTCSSEIFAERYNNDYFRMSYYLVDDEAKTKVISAMADVFEKTRNASTGLINEKILNEAPYHLGKLLSKDAEPDAKAKIIGTMLKGMSQEAADEYLGSNTLTCYIRRSNEFFDALKIHTPEHAETVMKYALGEKTDLVSGYYWFRGYEY